MANSKIRVYVDTSVFGGVFDNIFSGDSKRFFQLVDHGKFELVVSALVKDEIDLAPKYIQDFFYDFTVNIPIVDISNSALTLRKSYMNANILTKKSMSDALHVALASVLKVPLIVSWNFKHIVHFEKIPLYNAVNLVNGYSSIGIYSPKEVINYE